MLSRVRTDSVGYLLKYVHEGHVKHLRWYRRLRWPLHYYAYRLEWRGFLAPKMYTHVWKPEYRR